MSSLLCFLCHNTVNCNLNEDIREKYREVVGNNLCPDLHLCHICVHILKKLWLFKSECLKRSLDHGVYISQKGVLNLQTNHIQTITVCPDECCLQNQSKQCYVYYEESGIPCNSYIKLEEDVYDTYDYTLDNTKESKNENQEFKSDQQFDNSDKELENNDNEFNNSLDNGRLSPCDEALYDNELNKNEEIHCDADEAVDNGEDNEFNYECYDEERNECLEEIRNEENGEEKEAKQKSKKKSKSKNNKDFEKIVLSLEEQKAELDAQRKGKKYLEAEFKCYSCALGFLFKDTYQAHMMRHEESNGEYRCVLCSLRFASGAVLRSHASLHALRYKCVRCAQMIRARRTQTHAKSCHGEQTSAATCHLCGRVFQDASGLQQHLRRFHKSKTSKRTYSCSVCGKNYNNQAAVRTHMIKHIHRKFNCEECSATYSSPYTLQQHKKTHRSGQSESDFFCDICGARFSTNKSLMAHIRRSAKHQQRSYECPICNRSCPTERSLSSHISTVHSTTKQFQCTTCSARYTSRKSLVRHIRSHTIPPKPKIAVCHICGGNFKGKNKLNRHLREVCEKEKLEEELSAYYEQQNII